MGTTLPQYPSFITPIQISLRASPHLVHFFATITYSGQNYQGMTAASLALEGGAIDVCHTIVLHIAGGDRDKAQALLLEAYETVKRNNPNAGSYPPPPAL